MLQNADIPKMIRRCTTNYCKLDCQKSLLHPKCSWRCEEPKAAVAKETRAAVTCHSGKQKLDEVFGYAGFAVRN